MKLHKLSLMLITWTGIAYSEVLGCSEEPGAPTISVEGASVDEGNANFYVVRLPTAGSIAVTLTATGETPCPSNGQKCNCETQPSKNPETDGGLRYTFSKDAGSQTPATGDKIIFNVTPSTAPGKYKFKVTKIEQKYKACPAGWTGGVASLENTQESEEITIAVAKVNFTPSQLEIWYFYGEEPSNYPIERDIKAKMDPELDDEFTWDQTKGYSIYHGVYGFFGFFSDEATVKSTDLSSTASDCGFRATSKKYPTIYGEMDFTVDYLKDLTPNGSPTYTTFTFMGATTWLTYIPYTMNSKFGGVFASSIEANEKWTAAKTNHTSNTWGHPNQGTGSISPATLKDHISAPASMSPTPIAPTSPLGSTKIDSWPGEWRFGSNSVGKGARGLQKTWVRFLDHGEHQ